MQPTNSIHYLNQMNNKKIKAERKTIRASRSTAREDKKIDFQKHQYPRPKEKDDQLKNQPEYIEPNPNQKEG